MAAHCHRNSFQLDRERLREPRSSESRIDCLGHPECGETGWGVNRREAATAGERTGTGGSVIVIATRSVVTATWATT